MLQQVIFHIDVNAFFATVEAILDPKLQGKELIIAKDHKRAVVVTGTYDTRAQGVYAGMPVYKAKLMAPQALIIAPKNNVYNKYGQKLFTYLVQNYTTKIQVISVDECYLDVSDLWEKYGKADALAKSMIKDLKTNLQMPCSIGISYNLFLAKMANNLAAKENFLVINQQNREEVLFNLPINQVHGIGFASAPKLIKENIHTVKDFLKLDNQVIIEKILKNRFYELKLKLQGLTHEGIDLNYNQIKSIGNEITLYNPINNYQELEKEILKITHHIIKRCQYKNIWIKTIAVKLKSLNRKVVSVQISLNKHTLDEIIILKTVKKCFTKIYKNESFRLIGVTFRNLKNYFDIEKQLDLFEKTQENNQVDNLIEQINFKFKKEVVKTGLKHQKMNKQDIQNRYIDDI